MSVLWATHLTDEVFETDDVIVLHKGLVRATGSARSLLDQTGAADIKDAFVRLIEEKAP
jgi:ABC-2 type transport system ATP-binding protein